MADDGYYVYWPPLRSGYVTAYFLRLVADKLDEVNADWNATVQSDTTIN